MKKPRLVKRKSDYGDEAPPKKDLCAVAPANRVFLERFAGSEAILLTDEDDPQEMHVPRKNLPSAVKAGQWLAMTGDGTDTTYTIDHEATAAAKQRVQDLMDELIQMETE